MQPPALADPTASLPCLLHSWPDDGEVWMQSAQRKKRRQHKRR